MNVNLVCKVGFKILAAVVAGAAVVIGIDKAVGGGKRQETGNSGPMPEEGNRPVFPTSGKPDENSSGGLQQVESNAPRSKTDMILSGIRGAGETCGKLFTVAQSLSQLIESAGSVFGNYQQKSQYPSGGYYVPQQQPYQSGNIVWVPAPGSNCVMQAVPAQQNRW